MLLSFPAIPVPQLPVLDLSSTVAVIQQRVNAMVIQNAWNEWNITGGVSTNAMTTTSTGTCTWAIWNGYAYTNATTATATAVWTHWQDTMIEQVRGVARQLADNPVVRRKPTEEEVQARLKWEADEQRRIAEAQAARRAANARAEKLLLANLNPEQREDLVKKNCFFLHLPNGKRYRIDRKTHGNIALIGEGDKIIHTLCAQPPGIPVDDAILAQKLALETDEAGFLRVANMTRW